MRLSRPTLILVLLGLGRSACAQNPVIDEYYSLGLRFGALIAQQRLASPPLPSLNTNQNSELGVQAAYLPGAIDGTFYLNASDGTVTPVQLYAGRSTAYSGALAYTSPSIGPFSLFAFGIYTQGAANFPVPISHMSFRNSEVRAITAAAGANYVFLGAGSSPFKMGLFGGLFWSRSQTEYDYVIDEGHYPAGQMHVFEVEAEFRDYGPMAGLQAELTLGKLALRSFLLYAWDLTPICIDLMVNGYPDTCRIRIDSSVGSVGASVGLWGFSVSVYSKIWSKIDSFDIAFENYQLGYTFAF